MTLIFGLRSMLFLFGQTHLLCPVNCSARGNAGHHAGAMPTQVAERQVPKSVPTDLVRRRNPRDAERPAASGDQVWRGCWTTPHLSRRVGPLRDHRAGAISQRRGSCVSYASISLTLCWQWSELPTDSKCFCFHTSTGCRRRPSPLTVT